MSSLVPGTSCCERVDAHGSLFALSKQRWDGTDSKPPSVGRRCGVANDTNEVDVFQVEVGWRPHRAFVTTTTFRRKWRA
eukprot:scaffold31_cov334-Pavlova_lutheri.AAC.53